MGELCPQIHLLLWVKLKRLNVLYNLLLHNSLNRNRFKEKIMQQIKSVTASFVRHIW
ncbi:hypothetical protein H4S14_000287 [Agrobacterium vitis]|nr:hypothetical protein [Agrobacterium vitis]MBE1436560.1 hypothetical protein [Agrobacterium vitis]